MSVVSAGQGVNGWNSEYIEEMYARWCDSPGSVDGSWDRFFQGFELGGGVEKHKGTKASVHEGGDSPGIPNITDHARQGGVEKLIYQYRDIGHLAADLDPLGTERPLPAGLGLSSFGFGEQDLDGLIDAGDLPLEGEQSLRDIRGFLEETYCGHVGVEYMHIQDRAQREWLQARMEPVRNRPPFTKEEKMRVLRELIEADGFEKFLDTRYRGKKRFGLDGGESLVPMLNEIIEMGPRFGVQEYTIGMAHRGRLNVLVNTLHKSYDQIFTEFAESWVEDFTEGGGDVKYHRGYSANHMTDAGKNVRLTLSPNPSHLEFGHSVVLGRARAKQRLREDAERGQCVPILIHGDASFPGQGIVAEMFNFMHLDGYTVGGAVHVIINNQIGFTTNPHDSHSGAYCTDIAKIVEAPIIHVNGDDPEACVFAARLAIEFRQAFKRDVVVDLWCYRKFGHNEGDEPTFTQPLMYKTIKTHTPVLEQYVGRLIEEGHLTREQFDRQYETQRAELDAAQTRAQESPVDSSIHAFGSVWAGLGEDYRDEGVETGVPREQLIEVSRALGTVPDDFNLHRKLKKLFALRGAAVEEDKPLDWAMGEMLAYGTLLQEDYAVRLTGQDVERGTFSHRHAVVTDQETGEQLTPLDEFRHGLSKMCIHNSPLTENACLGFEYGYSLGDPRMLVIWEAQFGDFANGAQVIFDQFIASAEIKWGRFTGMTVLLPHGYEGQGPEHSSARLERFLCLCGRDNMQVVNPTTPAQMFHVLRRQLKRNFRKPLIVMSPKSLLRHPKAVSRVEDLVSGRFRHFLFDEGIEDPEKVKRLVLCTGKVFYDFVQHRDEVGRGEVAAMRCEQLFPLSRERLRRRLAHYPNVKEWVWMQEEPMNMGAYRFIEPILREELGIQMQYVGREANATPAVASMKRHLEEQRGIMEEAVGGVRKRVKAAV